MSDWRPRLIATDMDGTLLRSDDTVSEATVAELERWRADGVPVVLATGRPPRWMLQDPRAAAARDGGLLQRRGAARPRSASRCSTRCRCSPRSCRTVTAELRRRQPDTWFAVEYGLEFRHEPVYQPRWDVDAPGVAVATLEEMVTAPVAKLLARHEALAARRVRRAGRGRWSATGRRSPTPRRDALAEISAVGVTKATGLARVAAEHGVGPEDVVVFGDMPNDIAAFEWVRDGRRPGGRDGPRAPGPAGRRHRRHRHQRRRRRGRLPFESLAPQS